MGYSATKQLDEKEKSLHSQGLQVVGACNLSDLQHQMRKDNTQSFSF